MELTPKEKAKELVNKYKPLCKDLKSVGILDGRAVYINDDVLNNASAKQCALIAVDLRLDGDFIFRSIEYGEDSLEYWEKVKEELLKIK